jgi:26S proteasome regulatory subunit N1
MQCAGSLQQKFTFCLVFGQGDFALSLLGEHTENKSVPLKTSAFMGLALAYTGSHREDLLAYFLPHVADDTISSLAALGWDSFLLEVSSEVSEIILQTFMKEYECGNKSLDAKFYGFRTGIVVPW